MGLAMRIEPGDAGCLASTPRHCADADDAIARHDQRKHIRVQAPANLLCYQRAQFERGRNLWGAPAGHSNVLNDRRVAEPRQ
jgi:hypothetical protein